MDEMMPHSLAFCCVQNDFVSGSCRFLKPARSRTAVHLVSDKGTDVRRRLSLPQLLGIVVLC